MTSKCQFFAFFDIAFAGHSMLAELQGEIPHSFLIGSSSSFRKLAPHFHPTLIIVGNDKSSSHQLVLYLMNPFFFIILFRYSWQHHCFMPDSFSQRIP